MNKYYGARWALCLVVGAGSLHAEQSQTNTPENLVAMFLVSGECSFLMVANEELRCKGSVVNTEYDYGRTGFYFFNQDEAGNTHDIITFSGMGQEQISPSESLRLQPIDSLVFEGGRQNAVGFCTFENPFVGVARIECAAYLESGEIYSGFFVSDGSRPEIMLSNEADR